MKEEIHRVVIVGMGQIGIPTAVVFAEAGFRVIGVDRDEARIADLRDGELPFEEPGLAERFAAVCDQNALSFSRSISEADVYLVCVPAIGGDGASDDLVEAVRDIGQTMHAGGMILIESTMEPGTTMKRLVPLLTKLGWDPGVDFSLAHVPERVSPGRVLEEFVEIDRLVGGLTAHCSERAASFYRRVVEGTLHITDVTTAELVKVAENAFRDVNVAFANEVATVAHRQGTNPFELIRLANTHPRVEIHRPGMGAGGHCLPASSKAFSGAGEGWAHLTATAREVNEATPSHLEARIIELVGGTAAPVVAFLGFAYKPDVDDMRGSPGLELYRRLQRHDGWEIRAHDPHIERDDWTSLDGAIDGADLIVIGCGHSAFATVEPERAKERMRTLHVFDPTGTIPYERWRAHGFYVVRR